MNYYRTVSFLSPSATLTNFPVLVRISNDTAMATRIASSSGYDVGFTALDGTPLDFELDFYDALTGSGAWWVKIPTLASGSPTTIKMMYGDASITTDQSAVSTWDPSVYYEVLHYRDVQPKCVLGHFTISAVTGASRTSTSTIGRELSFTNGGCEGAFSNYPSFYYNSYPWAMGLMSITRVARVSGTTWMMYRPMSNTVTSSTQSFSGCYSRPQDTNWMAYSMAQYYLGGGSTQANLVVCGEHVYDGTVDWNLHNARTMSHMTPHTEGSSSTVDVAEVRYYSTFVLPAWMAYEQNQILNHDQFTTYGDEYNSDGTLVPQFVFRPWLNASGIPLPL